MAADGGLAGVAGRETADALGGERQPANAATGQEARAGQGAGSAEKLFGRSGSRCPCMRPICQAVAH